MDWTWSFDSVAANAITLATVAGAVLSLVLSLAVCVWLLCCGACRRWAVLPRPLRWLGSPVGRAAAAAFVLLSWDGLYQNDGGVNASILALGVALQLVLAAGCAMARKRSGARAHASAALVWMLALVAMCGFTRFNLRLAVERSHALIAACRRFEGDYGRLPVSLDELVPGYLPRVPLATWTVFGAFSYEVARRPQLVFFAPWPRLRIYVFETDEWWWDDTPIPFFPRSYKGPATANAKPTSSATTRRTIAPRFVARTNCVSRSRGDRTGCDSRNSSGAATFHVVDPSAVTRGTPVAPRGGIRR